MSVPEARNNLGPLLDELRAAGVRVDDEAGRVSVLDVIGCRKKTRFPSSEFQRLSRKFPELEERIQYWQFKGRRQNLTPTIAVDELPYLMRILASRRKNMKRPTSRPKPPLLAIVASQKNTLRAEELRDAPYGWRWDIEGRVLGPVHAEQQTIRYIRQLRAFGAKLAEIVTQLDRDGIRPRGGGSWVAEAVDEIMEFDHQELFKKHEEYWRRWRSLLGE
jgi:hypothetical protein